MSEYTPTTEDIIRSFSIPPHRIVERGEDESFSEYLARVSIEGHGYQMESEAAARRWLAAHDAEVRAGVVAEEPEWEYGYTSKWGTIAASSRADAESRAADHARGIAEARESGDLTYHGKVMKRVAASKPGEWVPVKQEGAEQ